MKYLKYKSILIISSTLILILCLIFFYINFSLKKDLINNEYANQKKIAKTIEQSLNLFFRTLVFITESTASNKEFDFDKNFLSDLVRYEEFTREDLLKGFNVLEKNEKNSGLWQVYKGLPESFRGKNLAFERREIARNILANNPELHYVFEMDVNGDLVFLEPYTTQVGITSFNFGFRDYLNLAKTYKKTVLSEGYLSHDKNKTQILTVASPIFDKKGVLKRVFAVSISSKSIRDTIFHSLKDNIKDLYEGHLFLTDRHGHVIASTADRMVYSPTVNNSSDSDDVGNIRNLELFKNIKWNDDIFEKGNLWERNTKSWDINSLEEFYSEEYNLFDEVQLGTFYPVSVLSNNKMWAVVVSTSKDKINNDIRFILIISFFAWLLFSSIIIYVTLNLISRNRRLEKKHEEDKQSIEATNAQIAHDIRSPASLLRKILEKESVGSEEIKQSLVLLKRITDISNEILGLKVKLHDDKGLFLNETLQMLVDEKKIKFSNFPQVLFNVDIEDGLDLKLNFSSTDLTRVLSNLLNNSFDSLLDHEGYINLCVYRESNEVFFQIEDSGVGIPQQYLEKVLNGTSFKSTGSGLGLSSSKNKIIQSGGRFNIQSQKGVGTKIKFSLQIVFQENHKKKIILVDDDKFIRLSWENEFKNTDVAFSTFSSPREFLDKIHFYDSDTLLVLDSCNFSSDFHLLLHELRERKMTKIFFFSGYERSKFECLKMWPINLLPKSYDLKKLINFC